MDAARSSVTASSHPGSGAHAMAQDRADATGSRVVGSAPLTPLVELLGLDAGPCQIFAKLEMCHPAGSVKGRIAAALLDEAERHGRIKPGDTVVEASSGNTTIALAGECRRRGYKLIGFVPRSITPEKIRMHEALGVGLEYFDPDPSRPFENIRREAAVAFAARTPGVVTVDQFGSPANRRAHELGTGPELWLQMDGRIDCYVAGAGTGGSLTGVAAAIKHERRNPGAHVVMVDPPGSILADVGSGRKPTEGQLKASDGVGERFVPGTLDFSVIDEIRRVTREQALAAVGLLYRTCGLLCGPCTGYALHSALEWSREQSEPKRVAILACDRGDLYMSDPAFIAALANSEAPPAATGQRPQVVTRPVAPASSRALAG